MTAAAEPKVAIVIPSLDRQDLWLRQVTHYAGVGCREAVYVGDSTERSPIEDIDQQIGSLQQRVRFIYRQLPGLDDSQAISAMAHVALEPYTAFCGDDDFFVPAALEQCAAFLDEHPDYSGAHGVAAYCSTTSGNGYGELAWSSHYRLPSLELPTATQRLTAFLGANFETIFSVRRTNEFQEDIDATLPMGDKGFRDLTVCCLPIIRGKVKRLKQFYLLRMVHQRQYLINGVFEWVTGPEWNSSYKIFMDYVSEALAKKDGVSVDEARSTLKHAFQSYLARIFGQTKVPRSGNVIPSPYARLRAMVKRVPGSRRSRDFLRSKGASDTSMLTLPALLRRSSPYHADFMPIYRTITRTEFASNAPS